MTAFQTVAGSVGPVVLLGALGWFLGRRARWDVRPFVDWVIYVGQPALIISAMVRHPLPLSHLAATGLADLFVVTVVGLLALAYSRFSGDRGEELFVGSMFANAANIPLPLALFAFGAEGLSHQVIYMTVNAVLLYTVGVAIASRGRGGWRQVFRLPLVYATAVGLVLALTGTRLPPVLERPVTMLGDTAIPLMLFTLGYSMGGRVKVDLGEVAPIVVLRIVGGGLAGLLFVWLFAPPAPVQRAILLGAFMPAAVQSFMLSAKFSQNPRRAAAAVFASTVLALFYVPLLVAWLGTL